MSDQNVGLASPRGLCDAMRKAGIPQGGWTSKLPTCYEYFLHEGDVIVSLSYNERMDIKDWEALPQYLRQEVPMRHQPKEVRQRRISERDPEGPVGRSPR